jgi:hypothetical protein
MDPLADAVRGEIARLGPQAAIGRIAEAWPAAVGEQIARNAWPARIARDGTLHVHTSSSTWAFELAQLAADIRSRLGEGAPPRLRFAPGPLPEPETPAPGRVDDETPRRPSADDVAAAARTAAHIGDETFRKLVARACAASLARARSGRAV